MTNNAAEGRTTGKGSGGGRVSDRNKGVTRKVVLTFPPETVNQPITYHLVKDFDLITNILRAEVSEGETGRMVLDLTGAPEKLDAGLRYLKGLHVDIQEAARDIVLTEERCVDCGACTAVCRPAALALESDSWKLSFDKDKCIFCELCVKACPTRAIAVAL